MQTQYSQTGMFLGDRDEHLQKKAKEIKIIIMISYTQESMLFYLFHSKCVVPHTCFRNNYYSYEIIFKF